MKLIRTSLLVGFVADVVCALLGALGASSSDSLGRLVEFIYSPSMLLARSIFERSGRSTIVRDIGFVFVTQWLLYSVVVFAVFFVWSRIHHDPVA